MHTFFGNSLLNTGYSCLMERLVNSWRQMWSAEPNTTEPEALFGVVTLAPSGAEGGADIATMRWAQTASYGALPNAALPNTFVAQAYDLNDPFANSSCYYDHCCPHANFNMSICTQHAFEGCREYCAATDTTGFYMGPIHPRTKKQIGVRLAQGAAVVGYGIAGPVTGPTLSGCSMVNGSGTITVTFNRTLLTAGGQVAVQDYFRGEPDPSSPEKTVGGSSMMQVLVNASGFCMQAVGGPTAGEKGGGLVPCLDDGAGHALPSGTYESGESWVTVDVALGSGPLGTVEVDLAKAGGRPIFGVRYAWNGTCCDNNPPTTGPCPLASCPVMGRYEGDVWLPANPFVAHIVRGKCKCILPQVCDE